MPANQPAKKTAARSDKPAPIGFSMKDVQRDENEVPFVVAVAGRPVEALNPLDLDYDALVASQTDYNEFFKLVFPKDHEAVGKEFNTARAKGTLVQALSVHYGLEDFLGA